MEILKKVREVIKKRTNEKIEVVKNNTTNGINTTNAGIVSIFAAIFTIIVAYVNPETQLSIFLIENKELIITFFSTVGTFLITLGKK